MKFWTLFHPTKLLSNCRDTYRLAEQRARNQHASAFNGYDVNGCIEYEAGDLAEYDNEDAILQMQGKHTLMRRLMRGGALMDDRNDYASLVDDMMISNKMIESNDICDYCNIDYNSIACKGCSPANGRVNFRGKKVRAL